MRTYSRSRTREDVRGDACTSPPEGVARELWKMAQEYLGRQL